MKHLFNNLTKEEKSRILEQHKGGMQVVTENFNKLLKSKLGNIRPIIEGVMGVEPVINYKIPPCAVGINFKEGSSKLSPEIEKEEIDFIMNCVKGSLSVLKNHIDGKFKIPVFVKFHAGTSHTGSPERNAQLGVERINTVKRIFTKAMSSLGVRDDVIEQIYQVQSQKYTPSSLDLNFFDPKKIEPNAGERFGTLVIYRLTEKGSTDSQLDYIDDDLRDASGYFNPDEVKIVDLIGKLRTYSDIQDLNRKLSDKGGLEAFINRYITAGLTTWGDDSKERNDIVNAINAASNASGKGDIAKTVGDSISILLK